jgi:hypothetical protein
VFSKHQVGGCKSLMSLHFQKNKNMTHYIRTKNNATIVDLEEEKK